MCIVRPANEAVLSVLVELFDVGVAEGVFSRGSVDWSERAFSVILAGLPHGTGLRILEVNGEPVGFWAWRPATEPWSGLFPGFNELWIAVVHSDHRRQGHGRAIIRDCLNHLPSANGVFAVCERPAATMVRQLQHEGFRTVSLDDLGRTVLVAGPDLIVQEAITRVERRRGE